MKHAAIPCRNNDLERQNAHDQGTTFISSWKEEASIDKFRYWFFIMTKSKLSEGHQMCFLQRGGQNDTIYSMGF